MLKKRNSSRDVGLRFSYLSTLLLLIFSPAIFNPSTLVAQKYDPEHPEVRRMVDAGVAFIKEAGGRSDGGLIIQGLAVMNADLDGTYLTDPFVQRAVQKALQLTAEYEELLGDFEGNNIRNISADDLEMKRMYEPCVALMMLVEYDAETYDKQIRTLIEFIMKRQMGLGSWSYNHETRGDTSQTQYCCLALWIAHEKGFDVPIERAERAANFWMGNQGSDGGWTYMIVPGQRTNGQNMSLVAAGGGSLYMLGDILGVNPPSKAKVTTDEGSLELPAFVERLARAEADRIVKAAPKSEQVSTNISMDGMNSSKARANQWLANNYLTKTDYWPYYALYGFERYASFREKIEGKVTEVPDWYDQGIEFCKATQDASGAFPAAGTAEASAATQTALAVLFMVRSTQRLTAAVREASMKASRGMAGELRSRNGNVISIEQKQDMNQLLSNLSKKDLSPEELQALADSFREGALNNIKGRATAQQLTLLREMVTDKRPQVRIVAVRALGQARLVDNCPALIYALTDPNPEVVQEASIALQFVSRKADVPAVPKVTTQETADGKIVFQTDSPAYKDGIRSLYHYWADWYLQLKPNAELFPVDID